MPSESNPVVQFPRKGNGQLRRTADQGEPAVANLMAAKQLADGPDNPHQNVGRLRQVAQICEGVRRVRRHDVSRERRALTLRFGDKVAELLRCIDP